MDYFFRLVFSKKVVFLPSPKFEFSCILREFYLSPLELTPQTPLSCMKSIHILLSLCFSVLLLLVEVALAQKKNPTVYPYGGKPDPGRKLEWVEKAPLNFSRAYFASADPAIFGSVLHTLKSLFVG